MNVVSSGNPDLILSKQLKILIVSRSQTFNWLIVLAAWFPQGLNMNMNMSMNLATLFCARYQFNKFCCGLYHPMVRAKTVENNPDTFGAALQGAMQRRLVR
jgi:hypothetical protein